VLVLALDTSTSAVTVALVDQATTLAERTEVVPNRHGELLAPLISDVLAGAGRRPEDLTDLAVGLGPGPFTGLRVGIVTAKAMSDALGIPAHGVCSLDVMALELTGWSMDDDNAERDYVVMSDARRKQVYWRRYGFTGNPIGAPDISRPEDLVVELRGDVKYVAGRGRQLYAEIFSDFTTTDRALYPSAAALGHLVLQNIANQTADDDLTPMYLRRPDAQPPGPPKQVTPA
jgi:tRNA threonylcarbamoyladenosine biosynthesis protein TsaB